MKFRFEYTCATRQDKSFLVAQVSKIFISGLR